MAAPGVLIPAPLVVQVKPGEPCCPVVGFWAGLVGGPAPNTTPADGSSRQAPMVIEANRCFISALPFKTMLRIWRQLFVDITQSVLLTQSVLANALTCALPIAVQAVGLIAANKTPEGRKIFRAIPIFFEPPSVVPELIGGSSRTSAGMKLHRERGPAERR